MYVLFFKNIESNLFCTTITDVIPLKNGIHLTISKTRQDGFLLSQE